MVNIKILATFTLPGSVMVNEDTENTTSINTMMLKNKGKKELLHFRTRKSIDARQSIKMSDEAYKYMISSFVPEWSNPGDWKKMSKTQRLIAHLNRIKDYLGATGFEYSICDD
jgi:hypothetical protein